MNSIRDTDDYDGNGNGYKFIQSLRASQNQNHVESYILFVSVIYVGCYGIRESAVSVFGDV
ncbi:unnamed protein product [Clonostachys chloroleuca]|uniref:Uncharacterized protein n=1 Tax=Clonostachys chloroleuca TaxID=1926264 RepID=A0AA35MCJ2_9HYPO|nr:unnamed protein product [Clonostachys chloroleuca]